MPTIDLTDDEYAALTAAIRHLIEQDKFPHGPAPRTAALDAGKARSCAKANLESKTPPQIRRIA
jgi:hypothetical protein